MDMNMMLKKAQELQTKMAALQDTMGLELVQGSAGGDMVIVQATCKGDVKKVTIDKSLLEPSNAELISDLLVAALRNAKSAADNKMKDAMGSMSKELGIPLDGMPF